MTGRLSDVESRIGTVHQLSAVVTAMRGIAAARSREAREHLAGIRAYTQTIAAAIGTALALLPETNAPQRGKTPVAREGTLVLALCAGQGFAGNFSERVLDAAAPLFQAGEVNLAEVDLALIGDRGLAAADEKGLPVGWFAPMASHADEAATLASSVVEMLYRRLEAGTVDRVILIHAIPDPATVRIQSKALLPFDFSSFTGGRSAMPPLTTLPPRRLLERLAEEYVFAEIHEAITLSFAAENEARMRAMVAARANVASTLDDLVGLARRLRQDEITDEIVELAAGTAASQTA